MPQSFSLRCVCLALLLQVGSTAHPIQTMADEASDILSQASVSGGFFVHLGSRDGNLTASLQKDEAIHVQGLSRDELLVQSTRQQLRKSGKYGKVSFEHLVGDQLPYVDNFVNLLVVDDLSGVSMDEVTRVLVPSGVALVKSNGAWQRTVKPRPSNIDEWSHYLHDASGNSVAHDDVVGPPRHLQWVGSPRWSRHHDRMASMSALVSTAGRLFYIMDEGSRISIQLPPKWKLIGRDAFNGTVLWKRDIDNWQSHLWPLKSGPTQLSRRLVSTDDTVYVTLGINAPLSALDAATGKTLRTYEGSDATEEIITTNGILFLVVRKGEAELADYAPLNGRVGDQQVVTKLFWNEEPRVVMAFDAKSGKQLWAKQTKISPLTLSADSERLYFHDGDKLVSLHQKSGESAWSTEPVTRRQSFTFNFGPRLVIYEDVVLYSGGDGKMMSVDAKSGKELWDASFPNSGYQSPQDLMVVNGLVWLAPTTSGKDSGVYTGRDPRTGVVKKEFPPDIDTYWFHHRCYIAKATDNFIIPSRTGVEFVDPTKGHWDIHHWVRGGCLYGVMPCNGLTYTPPHDCACYPEAKLMGFNALAPVAPTRPIPATVPEAGRLVKGPAYSLALTKPTATESDDWPTFRHDAGRSGTTSKPIPAELGTKWNLKLGGQLTAPVIAGGTVYVSQIDTHTIFALDEANGSEKWTYVAGGPIDSPPTIHRGRVLFGCTDGWIYCLTAADGKLAWRYRAAPMDRRTMAYEQLESLWPVHGSILIHNDIVHGVAGRSIFLDGGLRMLRLNLTTGEKITETIMDDKNPETGNNMQEKVMTLQMPVGLPDVLSCDGKHIFMKSQKFDLDGNRLEIGPNSGVFTEQVAKQRGDDAHIFAPMGFLDDTWFHRSYWVLGQSFAGGHGGYYQAGRFAPSGRLLVNGNGYVFGYGRKPEYLRWTTTLEHQLFAADPNPPEIPKNAGVAAGKEGKQAKGGKNKKGKKGAAPDLPTSGTYAQFNKAPSLDPSGKPITIEAWVTATKPQGVIFASGGPKEGFALSLQEGKPEFLIQSNGQSSSVAGKKPIIGGWHHVAAVLTEDKEMKIFVDGEMVGQATAKGFITKEPADSIQIGADIGSLVGGPKTSTGFSGIIDEFRLYYIAANDAQIAARFKNGSEISSEAVLAVSFDDGSARDDSALRNNGTLEGGRAADGKVGGAIQFSALDGVPMNADATGKAQNQGDSLVKPKWTEDVPIYVRGMVLGGQKLFIVGPPDIIDEESTFKQLTEKDPEVQKLLDLQDQVMEGKDGALLLSVNIDTGKVEHRLEIDSLPTWDGMSGANGKLFVSTLDGRVICFGK
ncbi:MAG: PQQ-binding-like beta-propeller repeat protein [Pirellulaceae bacterium]|nr:PQQ-binding-like beta-propeller repeat protein [Pirellulaceae bacterium]